MLKLKNKNHKYIVGSASIALMLLFAGCGNNATSTNTLSEKSAASVLGTRGITTQAPYDPQVISVDYHSADIKWKFDLNMSKGDFDGFYLHYGKAPEGITQDQLNQLSKEDWIAILNCNKASLDKKDKTILVENLDTHTGIPYDEHHLIAENLEPDTDYLFIPNAYTNYIVGGEVLKRDLLCKSALIVRTAKAPLPDPCLNVTGWMNNKNETFRTRWANWIFGGHPTWCFMKDKDGKPVFDGARLYRVELDETNQTIPGTQVEFSPSATDNIFDRERDYFDCPLEENHTYRYILQAYKIVGTNKVYHDKNVTADLVIDPAKLPIRECEACLAP